MKLRTPEECAAFAEALKAKRAEERKAVKRERNADWYSRNSERERLKACDRYEKNKSARREYYRQRYRENKLTILSTMQRRYKENKEQEREKAKGWRDRNPEKMANYRARLRARMGEDAVFRAKIIERDFKRRYGISISDRDALFAKQGNRCAICQSLEPGNNKSWATDHNHKTGVVRGILCNPCNLAIGHMREDVVRLRAAIGYLEKHNGGEWGKARPELAQDTDADSSAGDGLQLSAGERSQALYE